MPADLCLPCLRYSHAFGQRSDNTLAWTHLGADNLSVIVKGSHTASDDAKLTLRVVQGNQVLESIDIGRYVDSAVDTQRALEQAGVTHQVDHLPIFGIAKGVLLALRYRRGDGQARRVQLRMQNPGECRQIVHVLQRRGMTFQEQRPRDSRPDTSMSMITTSSNHASTTHANTSCDNSISPHSRPSSPMRWGSFVVNNRSDYRAVPSERMTTNSAQEGDSAHFMPSSRLLVSEKVTTPRDALPERPTTSQMYRSHTTPSQSPHLSLARPARNPAGLYADAASKASQTAKTNIVCDVEEHEDEMGELPCQSPLRFPPVRVGGLQSFQIVDNPVLSTTFAEPHDGQASTSSADAIAFGIDVSSDTLRNEALPRRKPFDGRTDAEGTGRGRLESRPSSSALDLPPLPKPKLINDTPSSTAKQSINFSVTAPSRLGSRTRSVPRDVLADLAAEDRSNDMERTIRKPGRMDELLYGQKRLAERGRHAKIPRLSSGADAPHEIISPRASVILPSSAVAHDRAVVSSNHKRDQLSDQAELEAYASQSRSDRQAALNDFITAKLENADFAMLCEDVENCWRRTMLGL